VGFRPVASKTLHTPGLQQAGRQQPRLITIRGPDGIGKTRLALAAAAWNQVNSRQTPHLFAQGIYFVRLASMETTDLLLLTIAETLNFRCAVVIKAATRRRRRNICDWL
jgi:predicted ATPase